jgi:hypothetical protein
LLQYLNAAKPKNFTYGGFAGLLNGPRNCPRAMNIDLLPFSAFVLESSGAASQAVRDGHTLTLPLELMPVHAAFEPAMSGTISIGMAQACAIKPLRAAVVPAGGTVLTITF